MSLLLTLNAGSSSLKFSVYRHAPLERLCGGLIENIGHLNDPDQHPLFHAREADGNVLAEAEVAGHDHASALIHLLDWLDRQYPGQPLVAASHRIVHGGEHYSQPVLLDDASLRYLASLVPLAPLHQPHGLHGIHSLQRLLPDLPQVACFDTAFHRSQPALQQRYALNAALWERGVRRYGFHGLSYQSIASRLPACLGDLADGRVIVAHLGNGASACALVNRQSVASTMGFTALEGLMMGTRCGRLDPGVVLYLQENLGMTPAEVSRLLYQQSGLQGISGISHDMRVLLASSEPAAQTAVKLFCLYAAREIASLCVASNGLDALVFTAGIGEHAPAIRAGITSQLGWLGIALDDAANCGGAKRIDAPESKVQVWLMPTDEEQILAESAANLIATAR